MVARMARSFAALSLAALSLALLALGFALAPPDAGANADVAWLVTVCERLLDGQRLYVDVYETNPPAAIWLYLPAVALARALGLAPEPVVGAQMLLLAAAMLALCGRMLRLPRHLQAPAFCAAMAMAALLPHIAFGEREHALALLLLPVLCLLGTRAGRGAPGVGEAITCGLLAGLAIAIKPQFALALGAAMAAAALMARSLRPLLAPETWACALVLALYALAIVWLTPQFLSGVLPDVAQTYLLARNPLPFLMTTPGMLLWALALFGLLGLARAAAPPPQAIVLAAASAGAMLAYLAQGKGWPYHALPMLLLAFLALGAAGLAQRRILAQLGTAAALAALCGFAWSWIGAGLNLGALRDAVAAAAPHPKIAAVTGDIGVGFPLARQIGGAWSARFHSLLLTESVFQVKERGDPDPAAIARLDAVAARETQALADDIAQNRPDIVLVQIAVLDWSAWIARTPALTAALAGYEDKGTFNGVRVLRRGH